LHPFDFIFSFKVQRRCTSSLHQFHLLLHLFFTPLN
jgi:hypothetical protein